MIAAPPRDSPLRVLAGLARLAVMVAAVAVTSSSARAIRPRGGDRAVDDATRSARRLDRDRATWGDDPEVRDAARLAT